ncbi:MAG: 50S ribosome-binding GTPase [Rubrivivax sp.]|nr:50S ribosome-binding GTPase [Rubrivivax sp.]
MIIGTAGYIDHGKTALVKALTGTDTDRLKEEKARGITIDLGFAYLPLPDGQVLGFVDVPGHEKLVRNMLAGATGIDHVLLVVAADDGPMPQTREHLAIVDLLGLRQGVVALTKCDLVTPGAACRRRGRGCAHCWPAAAWRVHRWCRSRRSAARAGRS